jgi:dTDP-4-dehydrorhamnose reductase
VYGRSKAEGESELREILSAHIIVRTSWLCGEQGANFVKTMLRLGRERDKIRVVADQYGCPTFAGDLADELLRLVLKDRAWGTYHYCGEGVTSWYEFATEILESARQYGSFPAQIVPIASEEFPTLAPRPSYSVLDCSKIRKQFDVKPRPWRDSLREMLRSLLS